MKIDVKICGLTSERDIEAAVEYGAAYVGLVFFEPSPRNLSVLEGKRLARCVAGRAKVVALTVDADDALIKSISDEICPDIYQLHGGETIARMERIRTLTNAKTMKVVKISSRDDAAKAFDYQDIADYILFDAKPPEGALLPGGNGLQFDWHALDFVKSHLDFMLSGGLNPNNVREAVKRTNANAVDVSSGVESAPGCKDPARIQAFLQAVKSLSS